MAAASNRDEEEDEKREKQKKRWRWRWKRVGAADAAVTSRLQCSVIPRTLQVQRPPAPSPPVTLADAGLKHLPCPLLSRSLQLAVNAPLFASRRLSRPFCFFLCTTCLHRHPIPPIHLSESLSRHGCRCHQEPHPLRLPPLPR